MTGDGETHSTPPLLHLSLSLLLCVCRASIYEWCIFEINYLIPTSVPRILSLAMPCHLPSTNVRSVRLWFAFNGCHMSCHISCHMSCHMSCHVMSTNNTHVEGCWSSESTNTRTQTAHWNRLKVSAATNGWKKRLSKRDCRRETVEVDFGFFKEQHIATKSTRNKSRIFAST